MSNGFSAADMSTAAANGHAEGYQAGYADAVKAVEAGKDAAAQAVDVSTLRALSDRWANDRSYTGSPVDDIRALIEQPTMSTTAAPVDAVRERDMLAEAIGNAAVKSGIYRADMEGMTGPQLMMACDDMAQCIVDSTPAAPGFDVDALAQEIRRVDGGHSLGAGALAELLVEWMSRQVIDASPKGGSSDERARFEAWAKSRNHDIHRSHGGPTFEIGEYTGEMTAEAWLAWQAAMQATSAEVGA